MTITIYLIRLIVAFIFGASLLMNIIGIYCWLNEGWQSRDRSSLTIIAHIFAIVIFLGSGYLLWTIK